MKKQVTLDQVKGAAAYLAKILGVKFDAPYSESGPNDLHLESGYGMWKITRSNGSVDLSGFKTKRELINWIWSYREGAQAGIREGIKRGQQ